MPKKIDHAERKDEIVEAMFRIIHNSGFENATLRQIAKEADLSLGSVQHFFPKQKDMYVLAMDVVYERFEDRMQNVIQKDAETFDNAVRMIKQIVQADTAEERMENDIWMKFSIMATMNKEYRETKDRLRTVNVNFAKDVLKMLQANGYLDDDVDIDRSANSLTVFIHGLVFESVIYTDLYDAQAIEAEIRQYLQSICK